jgi:hypothetical protein
MTNFEALLENNLLPLYGESLKKIIFFFCYNYYLIFLTKNAYNITYTSFSNNFLGYLGLHIYGHTRYYS